MVVFARGVFLNFALDSDELRDRYSPGVLYPKNECESSSAANSSQPTRLLTVHMSARGLGLSALWDMLTLAVVLSHYRRGGVSVLSANSVVSPASQPLESRTWTQRCPVVSGSPPPPTELLPQLYLKSCC
ncbi:hypothetical protein NQZ68_027622 [Dissostichus eleginoides]|nr:hypothetical protein NQZ68_027622 [Dissostichus eleginoides]